MEQMQPRIYITYICRSITQKRPAFFLIGNRNLNKGVFGVHMTAMNYFCVDMSVFGWTKLAFLTKAKIRHFGVLLACAQTI